MGTVVVVVDGKFGHGFWGRERASESESNNEAALVFADLYI